MKKNLITVLSLLAIVGCQKGLVNETEQDNTPITVVASLEKGATKTLLTDGGIGLNIKSSWLESDKIGVYGFRQDGKNLINIGNNSRFDSNGSGARVEFSYNNSDNKLNWIYQGYKHTFFAYYPYSANAGDDYTKVPFTIPSTQTQAGKGDLSHITAYDLLYSTAESMWNGNNGTNIGKVIDFSFNHALSVLAISVSSEFNAQEVSRIRVAFADKNEKLSVSKGTLNVGTGEINVEEGSNEMVLNVQPMVLLSAEPSTFYMLITPGHASKEYSVYATINGKEIELAKRTINPNGIAVSAKAELSLSQTEEIAKDSYEDLSSVETANTYLISKAGKYKFNAQLKGNGAIPAALSDVVASNEIAPKSALVLWYNTLQTSNNWVDASPVDVSSVALGADGYVRFSTPETFVPGNAVIAVFAEEGVTYDSITADENKIINNATLLWSWTIWAADGYDPEATAVNADGKLFMDRNLGAVISGVGSKGEYEPAYAVGNYYQWGRKDPFPSIADYCNYYPCLYVNTLIGTPTYTPIVALRVNGQSSAKNVDNQIWGYRTKADGSFNMDSSWHTIERNSVASSSSPNSVFSNYAVNHPYVYILNSVPKDDGGYYLWMTTKDQSYREFWGGTDSKKTLFDPCPAGWRVCNKAEAQSFMQTVFSSATLAANLIGYDFDGHYLPMTSSRSNKHFRTETVKSCGYETISYMWTSETNTNHNYGYAHAAAMVAPPNYADKNQQKTLKEVKLEDNKYLASSCPVRCVKE